MNYEITSIKILPDAAKKKRSMKTDGVKFFDINDTTYVPIV